MTYHFEYSFNYSIDEDMQEWEVLLTPEEEQDYREDGTDPAEAAMHIAIDEIIDIEVAVQQNVSGENIDSNFLRNMLKIELTDIDSDEDIEDGDDEWDGEEWTDKVTRTVTVNRVTSENDEVIITKTTRVTRITRTVKTNPVDGV